MFYADNANAAKLLFLSHNLVFLSIKMFNELELMIAYLRDLRGLRELRVLRVICVFWVICVVCVIYVVHKQNTQTQQIFCKNYGICVFGVICVFYNLPFSIPFHVNSFWIFEGNSFHFGGLGHNGPISSQLCWKSSEQSKFFQ